MEKIDRYTLRLPVKLKHILQTRATKKGYPLNALILEILWNFIKEGDDKNGNKISYEN